MKRIKTLYRTLAFTTVTVLLCLTFALADHKGKPHGGGGGGGKDETTPFSVIELPVVNSALAVSDPDAAGIVTIAGGGSEGGFVAATYALVDVATREVVAGFLPEPTDDAPVDSASFARDANAAGVIVGGADVYDETASDSRRSVAIRWIPQGTGYVFELLPLLDGDSTGSAVAISEAGEMVGTSNTSNSTRAAFWTADGSTVIDLNALLPAGSGWTLSVAYDINNSDQIVGRGLLDGVRQGFVLDLVSGAIDAVPLVEGAVSNDAWQINDAGHVIGKANDDIVGGGPFPQGGWGFFWGGPGTQPQLLPSFTDGAAITRGINNFDELAGDSHTSFFVDGNENEFMSQWQPDGSGGFIVADLNAQIPSKPVWYLSFGLGINDDGWIAGIGRKFVKGKYSWHGVLVVPNP